jgi:PKD repeat protein
MHCDTEGSPETDYTNNEAMDVQTVAAPNDQSSVANFVGTPMSGVRPLNVVFTDTSMGVIRTWLWSFGDGVTSTQQSLTHVYSATGVYTVSLRVSGPGGTDTRTRTSYITVNEQPPAANFTAVPTSGVLPLNVVFTYTSTGVVTGWLWDFGDAVTSTQQNPAHVYTAAGVYTVSLTVSGPDGSTTLTRGNYITVSNPSGNPIRSVKILPASITSDGLAGATVLYTLTMSNTGNVADLYVVSVAGTWPVTVSPSTVLQSPAGSTRLNVWVTIPSNASGGEYNRAHVIVRSQVSPTVSASAWITTVADGQAVVTPGGGSLVFTDTQNDPTVIQVGPGAVTGTVTLILAPVETATAPSSFAFAGHAFDLSAYVGNERVLGYTFAQPITVTISYSNYDVTGLDESKLMLSYWTGTEWADAASTCKPSATYVRMPAQNRLSIAICHLTHFGMFGSPFKVYLPVVRR